MKEWNSIEKYEKFIKSSEGLQRMIKTPYMLSIVVNVMPEIDNM